MVGGEPSLKPQIPQSEEGSKSAGQNCTATHMVGEIVGVDVEVDRKRQHSEVLEYASCQSTNDCSSGAAYPLARKLRVGAVEKS